MTWNGMPWDGIIPMSKMICYCGCHQWFFAREDNDFLNWICPDCGSTFFQVINREEDDKFIEYIMSQNI